MRQHDASTRTSKLDGIVLSSTEFNLNQSSEFAARGLLCGPNSLGRKSEEKDNAEIETSDTLSVKASLLNHLIHFSHFIILQQTSFCSHFAHFLKGTRPCFVTIIPGGLW